MTNNIQRLKQAIDAQGWSSFCKRSSGNDYLIRIKVESGINYYDVKKVVVAAYPKAVLVEQEIKRNEYSFRCPL